MEANLTDFHIAGLRGNKYRKLLEMVETLNTLSPIRRTNRAHLSSCFLRTLPFKACNGKIRWKQTQSFWCKTIRCIWGALVI